LATRSDVSEYLIAPDPGAARLTRAVQGTDQNGDPRSIHVVEERPLTIFLNSQEIVTAMTIGDYPEYLGLGFLRNQGMLHDHDVVTRVDYDDDLETVVVRTEAQTSYEDKLKKKTRTSGCAVGTVFGDMMEGLEGVTLPATPLRTSWLYALAGKINRTPSLYLEAGAIHGTVLCQQDRPLVYMEDVGRHNAVDKIAGWMLSERVEAALGTAEAPSARRLATGSVAVLSLAAMTMAAPGLDGQPVVATRSANDFVAAFGADEASVASRLQPYVSLVETEYAAVVREARQLKALLQVQPDPEAVHLQEFLQERLTVLARLRSRLMARLGRDSSLNR